VPVVAKMLLGMETTPASILLSTRCWRMPLSMPLCAVMKPVGTTTAALPPGFKRINDVLQEELVDGHFVHGLLRDIGHPGKKAFAVLLAVQLIAEIAEIHLERWIADDVVKLFERFFVLVPPGDRGGAWCCPG
jgi:hypothetical protein